MSATISHPTSPPVLDGAVCAACHAPLGAAARYCLSCGARQAGARTELLDLVAPPAAAPAGEVPSAASVGPVPVAPAVPVAAPTAVFPAVTPAPVVPSAPVGPPVPPATVASSPAGGLRTWPFALTAVVLIALVVGLFLGRWLADGRDGSSGPQVIRIEGAGGVASPSGAAPASGDAPAPTAGDVPVPAETPAADGAPAPVPSTSGGTE